MFDFCARMCQLTTRIDRAFLFGNAHAAASLLACACGAAPPLVFWVLPGSKTHFGSPSTSPGTIAPWVGRAGHKSPCAHCYRGQNAKIEIWMHFQPFLALSLESIKPPTALLAFLDPALDRSNCSTPMQAHLELLLGISDWGEMCALNGTVLECWEL
ncbi:hypothetical protein BJ322DRAFT_1024737 [Thelephora terrestris]|uniref:Uncharacterized protein n=1 Tax=Thelephora terrestris TaxID=56493 RepID=A0A9P6L1Q0_9AGAM|nr:hypothetical protein BJ322DRAFT_1024737 [Thelephora terrestris]